MAMTYKGVPASDARGNFSDICNRVAYGKERFVVTRYGKPILAIVPLHNVEMLHRYSEKFGFTVAQHPSSVVDAKERFADLCDRVSAGKEIVIITKSGTPRLAFVPLEGSTFYQQELEKYIDVDQAMETAEEATVENSYSLEEVKRLLGMK